MTNCRKQDFTLIELLIVIAIIAILASLLLPSLSRAREVAYRIQCAGRMKQVNTAVILYCQDYDASIPVLVSPPPTKLLMNYYLLSYLGLPINTTSNILKFSCPVSYRLNVQIDRYTANGDIFPYYSSGSGGWLDLNLQPGRIDRIKDSSHTFTFYCQAPSLSGFYSTYINRLKIGHPYCNVGLIHNGNVNIGFIDGHVESKRAVTGEILDVSNQTESGGGSTSSKSTLWK